MAAGRACRPTLEPTTTRRSGIRTSDLRHAGTSPALPCARQYQRRAALPTSSTPLAVFRGMLLWDRSIGLVHFGDRVPAGCGSRSPSSRRRCAPSRRCSPRSASCGPWPGTPPAGAVHRPRLLGQRRRLRPVPVLGPRRPPGLPGRPLPGHRLRRPPRPPRRAGGRRLPVRRHRGDRHHPRLGPGRGARTVAITNQPGSPSPRPPTSPWSPGQATRARPFPPPRPTPPSSPPWPSSPPA